MKVAIFLVFTVCVSTRAANAENVCSVFSSCCARNENTKTIYNKLEEVEEIIKSVKGKLSIRDTQDCSLPMDCEDLLKSGKTESGTYFVWPKSRISQGPISVYCDMETDGGGWTVIQRRGNFSRPMDYFYRVWQAYKEGFGNLKEDFWIGNDNIFALTNQRLYSIRFDLGDFEGNKAHAVYDKFWIDDESNKYRMHVAGYSGNAGDSFTTLNGMKFTTKDNDNDVSGINCAELWKGAWWFKICHPSNLNGEYYTGKPPLEWRGIIWHGWKGGWYSLATTEMKIRKTPSWIKY